MPRSGGGRSSRDSGSGSSRNSRASTMGMTTWLGSGAAVFAASALGARLQALRHCRSGGFGGLCSGSAVRRVPPALGSTPGSIATIAASKQASTAPPRRIEVGTLPRERCSASPVAIKLFSSWLPGPLASRAAPCWCLRAVCYYVAVKGDGVPALSRSPDFTRVLVTLGAPPRGNNPLAIAPLFGTPNPNTITV